jgi:hypothetical protein
MGLLISDRKVKLPRADDTPQHQHGSSQLRLFFHKAHLPA